MVGAEHSLEPGIVEFFDELASRDEMGFRMLLGREAIRRRLLVNAGKSYYGGRTKRKRSGLVTLRAIGCMILFLLACSPTLPVRL